MELVDTRDLKSLDSDIVPVQVRPWVPDESFIMTKDIDLREAFFWFIRKNYAFFNHYRLFFLSIIYSLSLPNIYKSQVIVVLNEDSSNLSNVASQIGGMSSLAGLSIPFLNSGEKKAMMQLKF